MGASVMATSLFHLIHVSLVSLYLAKGAAIECGAETVGLIGGLLISPFDICRAFPLNFSKRMTVEMLPKVCAFAIATRQCTIRFDLHFWRGDVMLIGYRLAAHYRLPLTQYLPLTLSNICLAVHRIVVFAR